MHIEKRSTYSQTGSREFAMILQRRGQTLQKWQHEADPQVVGGIYMVHSIQTKHLARSEISTQPSVTTPPARYSAVCSTRPRPAINSSPSSKSIRLNWTKRSPSSRPVASLSRRETVGARGQPTAVLTTLAQP